MDVGWDGVGWSADDGSSNATTSFSAAEEDGVLQDALCEA
jgi:hypothetical protein